MTNPIISPTQADQASRASRQPLRYDALPSTDGVDDTFEVHSVIDGRRIGWTSYWRSDMPPEVERRSRRNAQWLARLLHLFAEAAIDIDAEALARELTHWRVVHGLEVMRDNRPTMTETQVLSFFRRIGFDQPTSPLSVDDLIGWPDAERT